VPVTVPATLPTGDSFTPLLVLDGAVPVGYTTSPDNKVTSLVMLADPARPRVLHTTQADSGDTVNAVTATVDRLYWMRTVTGAGGPARSSVWAADRAGGDPRELAADAGPAGFANSRYDFQVADGYLRWAAAPPVDPPVTEVRSLPLAGGPVEVQVVPGAHGLTAWPWLTSAIGTVDGANELLNPRTGERVAVSAGDGRQATCTPAWCRVVTATANGTDTYLQRPDGRDRRRVTAGGESAALTDVALLDRFEMLATPLTIDPDVATQRLALYDLRSRRKVVAAPGATNIAANADWLWWATGDHETRTWHLLDLSALR
jgi:hypothetical protein